jgi:ABC-type Fe3+ transport system permease subunit
MSARPASKIALRIFASHGLAYPIATAWAFAAVPVLVVSVASRVGLTLDDEEVAHQVLVRVAWPALGVFALTHVVGLVWAFDRDEMRGRRVFLGAMLALFAIALLVGGSSWIWLMTR